MDTRFSNKFVQEYYEGRKYVNEHYLLNQIWCPPHFLNVNTTYEVETRYITPKLAAFMGITSIPPIASERDCRTFLYTYLTQNGLFIKLPINLITVVQLNDTLRDLFGPFKRTANTCNYYTLYTDRLNKHIKKPVKCKYPQYKPSNDLCDFITNTAVPLLNTNNAHWRWHWQYTCDTPIKTALTTLDASAPSVVLDYINAKKLCTLVVAYDKPLFDMLGKTEADVVTYDDLAEILRAKMYPGLTAPTAEAAAAAAAESTK